MVDRRKAYNPYVPCANDDHYEKEDEAVYAKN